MGQNLCFRLEYCACKCSVFFLTIVSHRCKYFHPKDHSPPELNYLGYPLRAGSATNSFPLLYGHRRQFVGLYSWPIWLSVVTINRYFLRCLQIAKCALSIWEQDGALSGEHANSTTQFQKTRQLACNGGIPRPRKVLSIDNMDRSNSCWIPQTYIPGYFIVSRHSSPRNL